MGRERRRLLIPADRLVAAAAGEGIGLEVQERHYLCRVLRLRDGDRLDVVDGAGRLWSARLEGAERLRLEQPLARPLQCQAAAATPLQLAMAVPRREPELVWRMATELGVDRLQPLQAERSVVRGALPRARWQAVLREATEQCERLWLPELLETQPAASWLSLPPAGLALLATTRRAGCLPLAALLAGGVPATAVQGISLAIGPEGGWSPAEEDLAIEAGWQPVSLAETILRSGTAAVVGVGLLSAWRALSCAASPSPSP
jgi:16S rRNA (uracil1498-N3)-methyltransferase